MAAPIRYEDTTELLREIVEHLFVDGGLDATIEFPGCIVIDHASGDGRQWWFGTANALWGASLMDADGGTTSDYLETDVPVTERDASRIALAIAKALL